MGSFLGTQAMRQAALQAGAAVAVIVLAGCANGSGGLIPSSMFGSGTSPAAAAPPARSDPSSRALQVGAVSARATRCGFYFDAGKLRSGFLAAETRAGATPEQIKKIEQEFDYTRKSISEKIKKEADYCSEERLKEIKVDLGRHLGGDYAPTAPSKAAAAQDEGWFSGWGSSSASSDKPFGHDSVFDPYTQKPKSTW
jgi:hypothetical protein